MRRPQPGGTLASIRARWRSLSLFARRRLAALAAVGVAVAAVAVAVLVIAPSLPCEFPGGDACAPPDEVAEIIPGDALAYVHANLDSETEQYRRASEITAAVPRLSSQLIGRLAGDLSDGRGRADDFEGEIRPWFGGEAAFALLDAEEEVIVLEVADEEGAREYAAGLGPIGLGVEEPETREHEGVELTVDGDGLATAQVDGFLAIGPVDGVRAVIDTAAGVEDAGSLAEAETAEEVRGELPDQRLLEAYISEGGVADLIAGGAGGLASISPLVSPQASRGVAISIGVGEQDEVELAVRSALDAERSESAPGLFAAFPSFEPALPGRLPSEALGYAGIAAPGETVAALLEQAPDVAAGFDDLSERLQRQAGVDIAEDLLEGFGDEAAITLEPPVTAAAEGGPAVPPGALPYVSFVADGVDEESVRRALAELQGPNRVAVDRQVGGIEASSLRLSPTVELTYAVFDGLAAIATDPGAIEQLAEGSGGLDSAQRFEQATEGFAGEVSLLAFLDLDRLVTLGEGLGLAEDPAYAAFAAEFRRIDALGLAVTTDEAILATDARLLFGEAAEPEPVTPPVVPAD